MAKKKADGEPGSPEKLTKTEAVKRALADGVDKPAEGVAYVRSRFGIDLTNQAFSTIKFQQGRKKGGRARKAIPAAARTTPGKAGGPADLARQVKALVDAYGATEVREMVAVFGG